MQPSSGAPYSGWIYDANTNPGGFLVGDDGKWVLMRESYGKRSEAIPPLRFRVGIEFTF